MSKSLVNNSIYNVLYMLLNVLFPLITTTYVSRILTVDGVGSVSYAQNIVSYFVMFAAMGMPTYGIIEIAKNRNSEMDTNRVFSELFTINAISTILFSSAYFLFISEIEGFHDMYLLHFIVGITLICNVFNVEWYYQGKEEYEYIVRRSFIIKIISLICVFIFIHDSNDFIKYALVLCLATAANNIANVFHLKGRVQYSCKDLHIMHHFKPLLILLTSIIALQLYTAIGTTMLGILCTNIEVGYFSNAVRLVNIVQSVISAVGAILVPQLSYYYEAGNKIDFNRLINKAYMVMMTLTIPSSIGLFMVADNLIPILFGNSFGGSIGTLKILAFTLPFLVINVLLGIQVLITTGKEKQYLITAFSGAVAGVLLTPILIQNYQHYGAAIASLISESVVTITTVYYSSKQVKISVPNFYYLTLLFENIAMLCVLVIVHLLQFSSFAELILSIISGIIVYFGTGLLFRDQILIQLKDIIIEKAVMITNKARC